MLILLTTVTCLIMSLIPTFAPRLVMPKFDFTILLAIVLLVLTVESYMGRNDPDGYLLSLLLSGLCFSMLPWCAGLTEGMESVKLGLLGCVTYAIAVPVFHGILDRLTSGESTPLAPVCNGLLLYLAAQGLVGMF